MYKKAYGLLTNNIIVFIHITTKKILDENRETENVRLYTEEHT